MRKHPRNTLRTEDQITVYRLMIFSLIFACSSSVAFADENEGISSGWEAAPRSNRTLQMLEPDEFQCKLFGLKIDQGNLFISRGAQNRAKFDLNNCSYQRIMTFDPTFNSTTVAKLICEGGMWITHESFMDGDLKKIELLRVADDKSGFETPEYSAAVTDYLNRTGIFSHTYGELTTDQIAVFQMDEYYLLKIFLERPGLKHESGYSSDFPTCTSPSNGHALSPTHNVYLMRQNKKKLLGKAYISPPNTVVEFIKQP